MIDLLKEAFAQAEQLSEEEQQALAEMIFEQIANEKRWEELLDDPTRTSAVDALADEALAEFKAGKSYSLGEVFGDEDL
jgi:nucleoid-associated protein YejK